MTQPILNPLITDSVKRARVKEAILALAQKQLAIPDRGLQFEGIDFRNPTPEGATLLLILQEICKDRKYSIISWSGGVSLVRSEDVDKLSKEYQGINESSNMIIRGATDKSQDLLVHTASPINAETKENKG